MPDSSQYENEPSVDSAQPHDSALSAEGVPAVVAPAPARRGAFADPVVRRLSWLGAGVLLVFLVTVISALLLGVINPPAPRTALERDLRLAETQIDAGSADPQVWHSYIAALIANRKYSPAERAIARAQEAGIEDPAKQYMLFAQVQLDLAREEYEKVIEDSDAAIAALNKQLAIEQTQYKATKQATTMIADGLGDNYLKLQLLRAEAYEALKRTDEAIASLDIYLEANQRAADILVWRGDLKSASGDVEGAIADYKSASTYMPGDQELEDKLTGLGATNE